MTPEPWSRAWWRALGRQMRREFLDAWRREAVPGGFRADRRRDADAFWALEFDEAIRFLSFRYSLAITSPYSAFRTHGLTS